MWDKVIKKIVNIEAKANLQPASGTRKINSKCQKDYKPLVKKDKDNVNWEYRNKTLKNKAKSHNSSSVNET